MTFERKEDLEVEVVPEPERELGLPAEPATEPVREQEPVPAYPHDGRAPMSSASATGW